MRTIKSRKQKAKLYEQKYNDIPRDFNQRIQWMYDHYHMTDSKVCSIIDMQNQMMNSMQFSNELYIILYEEPEGSPRPRARYINKSNLTRSAKDYPGYIQVYSLTGASDRKFMKRMIEDNDLDTVNKLIYTPSIVQYDAYIRTPSAFNSSEKVLSELGYIRPICKPDFDNIEKKYSDMYNGNIWVDDSIVISATLNKWYSILPRIEIRLRYLNMLYNKYQYKSMMNRPDLAQEEIKYFSSNLLNMKKE